MQHIYEYMCKITDDAPLRAHVGAEFTCFLLFVIMINYTNKGFPEGKLTDEGIVGNQYEFLSDKMFLSRRGMLELHAGG